MAVWTERVQSPETLGETQHTKELQSATPPASTPSIPAAEIGPMPPEAIAVQAQPVEQLQVRRDENGWPIPSTVDFDPEEARERIILPEFDELLFEKARVISG